MDDAPDAIDNRLTALRMVVVGLIAGQLILAAILIFSVTRMNGPLVPGPELAYVFLGVGAVAVAANLVAVPLVVRQMRAAPASPDPVARYAGEVLVRGAMLEAPAVLLLVGFVVTADWLVLAPVPVLLAWLVTLLPTRAKFDAWREEARRSDL